MNPTEAAEFTKSIKATEDAADRLAKLIANIQTTDDFRRYVTTAGRFWNYSLQNQLLIWMQYPNATRVAGFRTWLAIGRQVRKGEKAIRIIVPVFGKDKKAPDPTVTRLMGFTSGSVFDIAQTEGDPLPMPPMPSLRDFSAPPTTEMLTAVTAAVLTLGVLHVDVVPVTLVPSALGCYVNSTKTIQLRQDLNPSQFLQTLIHEAAHHVANHADHQDDYETCEAIAEGAAFVVLDRYGYDTSEFSAPYIAGWCQSGQLAVNLKRVNEAAKALINALEVIFLKAARLEQPEEEDDLAVVLTH